MQKEKRKKTSPREKPKISRKIKAVSGEGAGVKLPIPLLKELVIKSAGKDAEQIVDIIAGGKPVNEFKIAEKLKLTINQVRNILYKLSANNIVFSIRKKDSKKGWYIYSWSIDAQKALHHFADLKKKELKNHEALLHSRQTRGFYVCPNGCIETSEENALLHSFKCSECGQLLQPESFENEKKELYEKIVLARKELLFIEEELGKIEAVKEKKEIRKISRTKAKKKKARAKLRDKARKMKKKVKSSDSRKKQKIKKSSSKPHSKKTIRR